MFEMRGGDYVDNDEERFPVKNFSLSFSWNSRASR